jgi:hypothetical protein
MKIYGGIDVQIHVFLASALVGERSASGPCWFIPGEAVPWYSLELRLSGPQSRSVRYGEVKILDPNPTPRSSRPQSVAIPTELP